MTEDQDHSVAPQDDWRIVPVWRVEERGRKLSLRQARLWALVLESRFIECRLEPGPRGWQVWVAPENYDAACRELNLYVDENRNWPPFLPPVHPMKENTLPTLSILILLATFHNLTNLDLKILGHYPVDWLDIGNAHAGLILKGEWWRLVTALTLHADALHLVSNLAIGGVFIVYLCRDLGSGFAWTLLLASGICGNLANAYVQLPSHTSVGASTAVFGAVGILGALTMMRYRHHLRRRWPLPIAAALSLLVLLGTEGERTDLGAHLFGFMFGCLFGFVAELLVSYLGRPGRLANALLALASASVVLYAWWLAIGQSG
ncbi:rhomboid family intramembrane serine protease [Geomonas sp. Red259]|uniref:Rhomboid family intramembrane serine protease n=2 Tax=Geomonas propionica TaxID=2798582 RepID=A0ABS0YQQ2_9BACT|nr:rhomboid family intramembrane serine protease [Geomonas propionica]